MAQKAIIFEKTPANEVYLNLMYPAFVNYWRSSNSRNASDAFLEIQKCLNNPPLLVARPIKNMNRA